ncbi:hypothetical protein IWX49DRAFT_206077 [Phyllosticta citricarpa]|uniref:Transmembrane protein n=1 Tax=Phyllosticta citricarpa TaxID=55181 RepID=A0ABR1MH28_9PEZI
MLKFLRASERVCALWDLHGSWMGRRTCLPSTSSFPPSLSSFLCFASLCFCPFISLIPPNFEFFVPLRVKWMARLRRHDSARRGVEWRVVWLLGFSLITDCLALLQSTLLPLPFLVSFLVRTFSLGFLWSGSGREDGVGAV